MTPEEFRRHGKELVDWVADYYETLEQHDVMPSVAPGEIRAGFPTSAPREGQPFADVIADLDRLIRPGVTNWQHPGWFAYFPAQASFPAILGELVAAGLGQVGILWQTSPVLAELETVVLDWLVDEMGLPPTWKTTAAGGGVIQMSASDSTHTALVVAREEARVAADTQVAYASAQAHSSVEKGAKVAGFGHVRLIPTVPETHAMDVLALDAAVRTDLANGLTPSAVVAALGTTGTTAVDPIAAVADVAELNGMWLHVDAAYAGAAMLCEEHRHHLEGVDRADSYVVNAHKWMATNFDCSILWVADRRPLVNAMAISPPYLSDAIKAAGDAIDYRDWHVPLGRRFRALKLWFVLRSYGTDGLRAMLREHIRLARLLAERVEAHPALELVAPVPFGLVCLRHRDGDQATESIITAINASGSAVVTPSLLDGRRIIRVSIGSTTTEQRHVEALWTLIVAAAARPASA